MSNSTLQQQAEEANAYADTLAADRRDLEGDLDKLEQQVEKQAKVVAAAQALRRWLPPISPGHPEILSRVECLCEALDQLQPGEQA